MKTSSTILIIFTFLSISLNLHAQSNYNLQCIDSETKEAIENIKIYDKDKDLGFTDKNGKLKFQSTNTVIFCSHISYADTVIYLNNNKLQSIELHRVNIQLKESRIKDKYNQCKHLRRLLAENFKQSSKLDTILYYTFHCNYEVTDSNLYGSFNCINRLHFTGYDELEKAGESIELIFNYNPLRDYTRRTVYMSELNSNMTRDINFCHPGALCGYAEYGEPMCYKNCGDYFCQKHRDEFPYRNNDSLVFTFNNPKDSLQIVFLNNKLSSIELHTYYPEVDDHIIDSYLDFKIHLDTCTGLITHQCVREEYQLIFMNGEKHPIIHSCELHLMDSLPKERNTDIFLLYNSSPFTSYDNWREYHNKYYIPETEDQEIPDYVKAIYRN